MKYLSKVLAAMALIASLASCGEKTPEIPETLSLKDGVITVDGNGGLVSATLKTNVDFKVAIQDGIDWLTYKPATKAAEVKDMTINFEVAAFPKSLEASRSAIVTISYTGLKDQILTIVQTPLAQTYLKVSTEPNPARFTMDGGELVADIQSSVDYTITISEGADWITADASNPKQGDGKAKFAIAANEVRSERDATITFATEGIEPIVIEVHQDAWASNIGIKSLADFLEFVAASNESAEEVDGEIVIHHNLEKWVNEDGEICLLTDLDLSSVSNWTPIGYSTDLTMIKNRTAVADSVRAFGARYNSGKGIFNGMNHVISGLKMTANEEKNYMGFFGPLYNATVKNLVFDETCSFTINRQEVDGSVAFGFLTPAAIASTVENVVVKGTIKFNNSFDSDTFYGVYVGGIIGHLCGNKIGDAIVKDCRFEGKVEEFKQDGWGTTNPKTFAGIVGYAVHDIGTGDDRWADPNYEHCTKIVGCQNKADFTAQTRFVGGILGTNLNQTSVENCINNATITINSTQGDGRIGGIIGQDQGITVVSNNENYGALHSIDAKKTCLGGITSVISDKSQYTGNKSDCIIAGIHTTKGVFVANVNNAGAEFSANLAKGAVADGYNKGEYTNKVEVTADNFAEYVGKNGKDAPSFGSGVSYWK